MRKLFKNGVTLLELIVVVVIISILSTIAVGVYTKEILRAKYAKTRAEIRTLEIACQQYWVDTGVYPPSGSGATFAPAALNTTGDAEGTGYLQLALRASLNNNLYSPLSKRWLGPYIEWDSNRLGDLSGNPITSAPGNTTAVGEVNFLDPFGGAYYYIRAEDYGARGGTELDSTDPFFASETYYNPSTFQIYSLGPNGSTLADPNRGTESDDISNYKSPEI